MSRDIDAALLAALEGLKGEQRTMQWLVIADWLDERDDPRGEAVRWMIAHRLSPCQPYEEDNAYCFWFKESNPSCGAWIRGLEKDSQSAHHAIVADSVFKALFHMQEDKHDIDIYGALSYASPSEACDALIWAFVVSKKNGWIPPNTPATVGA